MLATIIIFVIVIAVILGFLAPALGGMSGGGWRGKGGQISPESKHLVMAVGIPAVIVIGIIIFAVLKPNPTAQALTHA